MKTKIRNHIEENIYRKFSFDEFFVPVDVQIMSNQVLEQIINQVKIKIKYQVLVK